MKQIALSHFTDIHLTIAGLFIFIIFFTITTIMVFSKSRRAHYEEMATLPLDEGGRRER
ncbi:MAG: cbb3-type cytochrome c oxidase subunit 3 [Bdellovibrionales bacterium]